MLRGQWDSQSLDFGSRSYNASKFYFVLHRLSRCLLQDPNSLHKRPCKLWKRLLKQVDERKSKTRVIRYIESQSQNDSRCKHDLGKYFELDVYQRIEINVHITLQLRYWSRKHQILLLRQRTSKWSILIQLRHQRWNDNLSYEKTKAVRIKEKRWII